MPFQMEQQEKDKWCWAAVATSVDHYFAPAAGSEQAAVAAAVLRNKNCQDNPTPAVCNVPAKLQDALQNKVMQRLNGEPIPRPLTLDEIKLEIDGRRPVCARIAWYGGGAHFVVISAYDMNAGLVQIADPWYPSGNITWISFDEFSSAYNMGQGHWTAAFLVRP